MIVDSLMQIPWLVAIVNACVWVGKSIWELIGRTWRIVAAWFATAIPLVLRWAAQRLAYRIAVVALWVILVTACWTALLGLLSRLVVAAFPSSLGSSMGFLASFFWEEPFNFSIAWRNIRVLFGLHMSALSFRVLWLRFHWAVRTGQKALS